MDIMLVFGLPAARRSGRMKDKIGYARHELTQTRVLA